MRRKMFLDTACICYKFDAKSRNFSWKHGILSRLGIFVRSLIIVLTVFSTLTSRSDTDTYYEVLCNGYRWKCHTSGYILEICNEYGGCAVVPEPEGEMTAIPYWVNRIGYQAFDGCGKMTSITIPDGVTSIGSLAFNWCMRLANVTIGNRVVSIEKDAFNYCDKIKNVTMPCINGLRMNDLFGASRTTLQKITLTKGAIPDNAFF